MGSSITGATARLNGSHFEQAIGRSFQGYAAIGKAYLDFMPMPTKAIRGPGGKPLYIPNGKAPFDVYGHAPRQLMSMDKSAQVGNFVDYKPTQLAVFVGAELKSTKDHETSLSIVHPDSDSHGLEYHQLDALALVARLGGIARIVWDNGGAYGILEEEQIIVAHAIYEQSLANERNGKGKGPLGSRSIKWTNFKTVDYGTFGGVVAIDWLKL